MFGYVLALGQNDRARRGGSRYQIPERCGDARTRELGDRAQGRPREPRSQSGDQREHDREVLDRAGPVPAEPAARRESGNPSSVETHLGQAVKQLQTVVRGVPTHDGLKELRGKDVLPLVVLLDEIYNANSPLFEPFRRRARAADCVPETFDPQIASVSEIEALAPQLANRSLATVYRDKLTVADHRYWDWGTYALQNLGRAEHPLLKARFDRFKAAVEEDRRSGGRSRS